MIPSALTRPRLTPLCVVAVFLSITLSCLGGGSIGWDIVSAEIRRDDPFLLAFIERTFAVHHVGGAMRVGRDATGKSTVPGLEIGTRLPPYEFDAKPKGSSGDYTMHITL